MTMSVPNKKRTEWQLQEAKAMFSEVVKASDLEPQIITVYGKKTAAILSYKEYKGLAFPKESIFEFFQNSPWPDVELELPQRLPSRQKEIDW